MLFVLLLALVCKIALAHEEHVLEANNSTSFSPVLKSMLSAPSNTNCGAAISASLGSIAFDNTEALSDNYESCAPTWKYLWYKWQATFTGYLQTSTCESANFDTVLAVYSDCANFPRPFMKCNDDYCRGATSLINVPVTSGQFYYIALGGYYYQEFPNYGFGSGTLKLSQATLSLTLITNTVSSLGGPITLIASTSATNNFNVYIYYYCPTGSLRGTIRTSSTARDIILPPHAPDDCLVQTIDTNNPGLVSNTVLLRILKYLIIAEPTNGANWPINEPLPILVTSYDSETGTDVSAVFTCTDGNFSKTVQINEETSVTIDATYSANTCTIVAEKADFYPSKPVTITFTVPTYLNADLKGWQGGTTVIVRIETYNQDSVPVNLDITCQDTTSTYPIMTETNEPIALSIYTSGVECLITTSGMPANYLPIKPQHVTIELGTAAKLSFIHSIFSPDFSPVGIN